MLRHGAFFVSARQAGARDMITTITMRFYLDNTQCRSPSATPRPRQRRGFTPPSHDYITFRHIDDDLCRRLESF